MNSKFSIVLEITWIITGILCIIASVRTVSLSGYSSIVLVFGSMALISFLFAWFRHRQRKKS